MSCGANGCASVFWVDGPANNATSASLVSALVSSASFHSWSRARAFDQRLDVCCLMFMKTSQAAAWHENQ